MSQEKITGVRTPIDAAISRGRDLQVKAGWEEAVTYFTNLFGELRMGEVAVLNERGLANRMLGDYDAAESDFTQARQIAQSKDDLEGEVTAIVGLIDLARTGEWAKKYTRGKDMEQAQKWRQEAEVVLNKMPENWSISKVNALIQFGLLERELDNHDQAVQVYSQAQEGIMSLLGDKPEDVHLQNQMTRILTLKGNSLNALGQYEEAISIENEALEIYIKLGDVRGIVNASLSLARIYRDVGKMSLATEWYNKTMQATKKEEGDQTIVIDPLMYGLAKDELEKINPQ